MSTTNDLIQTALSVQGLMQNRQALEINRKNSLVNRLGMLQTIGQNIYDPIALLALAQGNQANTPGMDLQGILQGTAPGQGTMQRGLAQEGLAAADPTRRADLADEALTRNATGVGNAALVQEQLFSGLFEGFDASTDLTPDFQDALRANTISKITTGQSRGQLAMGEALAGLSPEEQSYGAGIGIGTQLSAGDLQQAQIAAKGHELQWMSITQQGALGQASLAIQAAANDFNQQMGMAKLLADARGDINATAELQNAASFMRNLETNKNTMSAVEIRMHTEAIGMSFKRLEEAGYPVPTDLFEGMTEDDIIQTPWAGVVKWWDRAKRRSNR